jgi:hypothetical protein
LKFPHIQAYYSLNLFIKASALFVLRLLIWCPQNNSCVNVFWQNNDDNE